MCIVWLYYDKSRKTKPTQKAKKPLGTIKKPAKCCWWLFKSQRILCLLKILFSKFCSVIRIPLKMAGGGGGEQDCMEKKKDI